MENKEFYGKVSFTGRASFQVSAKDESSATDIVFEDIEGIELILKDGSTLEINEIDWDLLDECRTGNVMQPHVDDLEIYEEK